MEVHHKVPLSEGGTNSFDKLQPVTHDEHVGIHKDAGDYSKWGSRGRKKK